MDRSQDEHDAKVREQFRVQAPTFTDTGVFASRLDWIVDRLAPQPGEQALDVACGAGHLGRALAPRLAHVSGLDLTPEMLAHGDRIARDAGLRNITFAVGNAVALPWLDAQFDLVVCRLTLHQVADPAAVVREMVRVVRPDGRIGITDLVLEPDETDPDLIDRNTHLERLRDPSHGRTLSAAGIHGLLVDAGATPVSTDHRDSPLDVEDWMERSATRDADRAEIRRAFDAELAGGPATGLRAGRDGDLRTMTHMWATILAEPRPS